MPYPVLFIAESVGIFIEEYIGTIGGVDPSYGDVLTA